MKGEILDNTTSTHYVLKERIQKKEVKAPYYIFALSQERAIGTHGRVWHSNKNESFSLSLAVHHNLVETTSLITFFYAYALKKFLAQKEGIKVAMKWPNDLYIQDKKLAGILVEKVDDTYIVGIGMNVNQKVFVDEIKNSAISLFQIDHRFRPVTDLLRDFMESLEEEIDHFVQNPYYFWDSLKGEWLYQYSLVRVKGEDFEDEVVEGILQDVTSNGTLILINGSEKKEVIRGKLEKK